MNSNRNKKDADFKSPDEAFEYLLEQRLDEKRKKEWAKALGPTPEMDLDSEGGKSNLKRIYFRIVSVAAVLILIAGFFYFGQKTVPLDQYAGQLVQETTIAMSYGSESRGDQMNNTDETIANLKSELTAVLLDQDYNQALGYFNQLEKLTALSIEDKYYYAISILKSKGENNQKAIRLLSDVVKADSYNLKNALWLRALAFGTTDNAALMKKDLNHLKTISKKDDKKVTDLLSNY